MDQIKNHYLKKDNPFKEINRSTIKKISKILSEARIYSSNDIRTARDPIERATDRIIGQDQTVEKIKTIVDDMLKNKSSNMLLIGPSGTGKSLIAKAVAKILEVKKIRRNNLYSYPDIYNKERIRIFTAPLGLNFEVAKADKIRESYRKLNAFSYYQDSKKKYQVLVPLVLFLIFLIFIRFSSSNMLTVPEIASFLSTYIDQVPASAIMDRNFCRFFIKELVSYSEFLQQTNNSRLAHDILEILSKEISTNSEKTDTDKSGFKLIDIIKTEERMIKVILDKLYRRNNNLDWWSGEYRQPPIPYYRAKRYLRMTNGFYLTLLYKKLICNQSDGWQSIVNFLKNTEESICNLIVFLEAKKLQSSLAQDTLNWIIQSVDGNPLASMVIDQFSTPDFRAITATTNILDIVRNTYRRLFNIDEQGLEPGINFFKLKNGYNEFCYRLFNDYNQNIDQLLIPINSSQQKVIRAGLIGCYLSTIVDNSGNYLEIFFNDGDWREPGFTTNGDYSEFNAFELLLLRAKLILSYFISNRSDDPISNISIGKIRTISSTSSSSNSDQQDLIVAYYYLSGVFKINNFNFQLINQIIKTNLSNYNFYNSYRSRGLDLLANSLVIWKSFLNKWIYLCRTVFICNLTLFILLVEIIIKLLSFLVAAFKYLTYASGIVDSGILNDHDSWGYRRYPLQQTSEIILKENFRQILGKLMHDFIDPLLLAYPLCIYQDKDGNSILNYFQDATGSGIKDLLGDISWDPIQGEPVIPRDYRLVRAGLVLKANRAVLFYDELGVLGLNEQYQLFQIIQEKEMILRSRGGGTTGGGNTSSYTDPIKVDFTFIGAGTPEVMKTLHPALRSRVLNSGYEVYLNQRMPLNKKNILKFLKFVKYQLENRSSKVVFDKKGLLALIAINLIKDLNCNYLNLRLRRFSGYIDEIVKLSNSLKLIVPTKEVFLKAIRNKRSVENQAFSKILVRVRSNSHNDYRIRARIDCRTSKLGEILGVYVLQFDDQIIPGDVMPIQIIFNRINGPVDDISFTFLEGELGQSSSKSLEGIKEAVKMAKMFLKDITYWSFGLAENSWQSKDGDSASGGLFLACLSNIFNLKIKQNIVITGAFNFGGVLGLVGAISEKIAATTLFFKKLNIKNWKMIIPALAFKNTKIANFYQKSRIIGVISLVETIDHIFEIKSREDQLNRELLIGFLKTINRNYINQNQTDSFPANSTLESYI